MPQLDFDGANSRLSADNIRGQSGSTITIVSGHNLSGGGSGLTGLNATQLTSGTLPMARLSGTLPALNGSALTNLPDQSATDIKFSAAMSATHSNVTGGGQAWFTNSAGVSWATPIINSGNGFSGGLFTVPSGGAGTYLFNFHTWVSGIGSNHNEMYAYFYTSNRYYEVAHKSAYTGYSAPNGSRSFNWQVLADMDVGDTCRVRIAIYHTSATCDITGGSAFDYQDTYFQGALLA